MKSLHLTTAVLLILFGIAAPEIMGALTPGYNPRSDFLSELGASGAPYAAIMSYGVFLPVGVLWAVGTILVWRTLPPGALGAAAAVLLLGNSVSYIGAGFFPCDLGCPGAGSFSQAMHNLTGAVGYFLSPPAFAMLGAHLLARGRPAFGGASILVAAVTALSFTMMLGDLKGDDAGLWQRITDYSLFVWMLIAAMMSRRD